MKNTTLSQPIAIRGRAIAMMLSLLLICASLLGPAIPTAYAAAFTVGCGDVAGLIAAINAANANGQSDTIDLAAGCTYSLTNIDNAANGLPRILGDGGSALTINGNGATITRAGAVAFRFFDVVAGATLNISSLTLSNGQGEGGAIVNAGTIAISNGLIAGNQSGTGTIFNSGTLTIDRSTFDGNTAGNGGAIYAAGGAVTITNSTFSRNATVANDGGAIFAGNSAISIINSTFSANSSAGYGGALVTTADTAATPTVTINNSTFSENQAQFGSTFYVFSGSVTLRNTIVAGGAGFGNCIGVISAGNNLSSDGSCGGGAGDRLNTNPLLGPLANNGGPTQTLMPSLVSPAINAGNNATCSATDQRGAARPSGSACDIGAIEYTPQAGPTFTVSNNGDAAGVCEFGVCSLRAAIDAANAKPNGATPDTIGFSIGRGTQTISPTSALPVISDTLVIDGATQPGYAGAPLIELSGAQMDVGAPGLVITAGNSTVRGLAINRFPGSGIVLQGAGAANNTIEGNYIGTDVTGTRALGNAGHGVEILGSNNRIGGTTAGTRNVISGNGYAGVRVTGVGNQIQGNAIGTNAAGDAAIPNGSGTVGHSGVFVDQPSSNTVIGGAVAGAGNVIAGNNGDGISIWNSGTTNVQIQGNRIGVQADGVSPLGNTAGAGIAIRNFSSVITITDNIVANNRSSVSGGLVSGGVVAYSGSAITLAHNTIANNTGSGVWLASTGTFVTGNSIDSNTGDGITISSSGNRISEATTWGGNVIARNGGRGVNVVSGDRNTIIRNAIYDNGGPGIDLGNDGPTANDAGDGDTGPNNLQNTPVLGNASIGNDDNVTISYTVDSATTNAAYPLQIEFFATGAAGDQGRTLIGSDTLAAPGTRSVSLGNAAALGIAGGDRLVATATDATGNTSEFSAPVATTQAPKSAGIVLSEPLLPFSSTAYGAPPFAVAGRGFDIQATIVDSAGATVSSYNGTVTLALRAGSGSADATLGGALTATAVNGVATFHNLAIDLPGSGYQLLASADGALSSSGAPFDVLQPETEAPANDTIDGATPLGAMPAERAGWITTGDDADWFMFDTNLTGVTVTVDLTSLPLDYDLALVGDPRPSAATAISDGVSLANVTDASQIDASGTLISVSLAESLNRIAAIGKLPGAAQYLLNLSANRETENEAIVAKLPRSGRYYLLVFSTAGASDPVRPYRLRVALDGGMPSPTPPPAAPVVSLALEPNLNIRTIFLYNSARMRSRYPSQALEIDQLLAQLTPGSGLMTASAGASIDLASIDALTPLYTQWDDPANRAQPAFANAVAQQIWYALDRAITSYYTGTTDLVLVGGDDIIPFYRAPDETVVSPEGQYYQDLQSVLSPGEPLSGSLGGNYIQTDDFYADRAPTAWRGRQLFVPDLGIGRLVERPSDILSYLDATATTNYTIDAGAQSAEALVTGYSFVDDEAQQLAEQLQQLGFQPGGQPALDTLINDTWSVNQLVGVWIGGQAQHQLAVFDGHFTHNQLIAADGSLLQADQLPPSGNYFQNALLFAIGCHSGLNAADGSFTANTLDADFAQAVLQHGGTWLGNTGYTYADPSTTAYSQRLAQLFTAQIGRPVSDTVGYAGAPLGEALARAKQAYLRELGPNGLSVSDEKALTQLTLYGLPFLRVKVPTPRELPEQAPEPIPGERQGDGQFVRLITVTNTFTMEATIDGQIPRVTTTVEDTFRPGQTTKLISTGQMAPGRPVLPALTYDITLDPLDSLVGNCNGTCEQPQPRGVRLLDATTLPELDNFAPHVTTPVTDPVTQQSSNTILQEPGMTAQGIWLPDLPYTFQRTVTLSGTEPISSDRLLISPTQFNATDATHGRLRRFSTMVFEISYVNPPRFTPQVLGCALLDVYCWWYGESSVSNKPPTALASQAFGPAQVQATLTLSTVVTLRKDLPLDYVDVSATYTVDGIDWQKVTLERQTTRSQNAETIDVVFAKDVQAPTWPLPTFAAFYEFKDKDGTVKAATPRGVDFHQLFMPLVSYSARPDLVGSISINPDKRAFAAGEPVQLSATITNAGAGDAGPFWVDLFINPSAPPDGSNITWNQRCALDPCFGMAWRVPGLAAGQSITLSSTDLPPGYSVWPGWFAAGTTDLYLSADSWNPGVASGAVAETNESNNVAHVGGLSVTGINPPFLRTRSATQLPTRPAP